MGQLAARARGRLEARLAIAPHLEKGTGTKLRHAIRAPSSMRVDRAPALPRARFAPADPLQTGLDFVPVPFSRPPFQNAPTPAARES